MTEHEHDEARDMEEMKMVEYVHWLEDLDDHQESERITPEERRRMIALRFLAKDVVANRNWMDARTDKLTQLTNRTYFYDALERLILAQPSFGGIMIDLDHFKSINDMYGHSAGDEVLQQTAARIAGETRRHPLAQGDVVARLGGEEFVILFPNMRDLDSLRKKAEAIRNIIGGTPFSIIDNTNTSQIIRPTASLGIRMFSPQDRKNSFMLGMDQALYRAKENGRNRTEI
jgi:diguanylate cyclase (GGDEF)-like protein